MKKAGRVRRARRVRYDWGDAATVDYMWGDALEALFQYWDNGGVLNLLADGAPVPPWARKMIARWLTEEWPKQPPYPSADHRRLIAAARVYRETKRRGEKAAARLERVARQFGPDEPDAFERFQNSLDHFVQSRGGTHDRQADDWAEWEHIYLGPDGTGFKEP
jgi:hypothetical protein